jgi:hypothetical protein
MLGGTPERPRSQLTKFAAGEFADGLFVRGTVECGAESVDQAVEVVIGDRGERDVGGTWYSSAAENGNGPKLVKCDGECLGAVGRGNMLFRSKDKFELVNVVAAKLVERGKGLGGCKHIGVVDGVEIGVHISATGIADADTVELTAMEST